MIKTEYGYVVIDKSKNVVLIETFAILKKDAIKSFLSGSNLKWQYCRKKYGYECVSAKQSTVVI